jgi:hypothetical protein
VKCCFRVTVIVVRKKSRTVFQKGQKSYASIISVNAFFCSFETKRSKKANKKARFAFSLPFVFQPLFDAGNLLAARCFRLFRIVARLAIYFFRLVSGPASDTLLRVCSPCQPQKKGRTSTDGFHTEINGNPMRRLSRSHTRAGRARL